MAQRDLALAIETSNPGSWAPGDAARPGVALGRVTDRGLVVLGVEELDPTRPHDDALMPAIDRLFRDAQAMPRELAKVGVSAGPGGFTSVRMAVTAARFIAEVSGAEAIALPTAQVVMEGVKPDGRVCAVVLACKRDSAYVTVFEGDGTPRRAGGLVNDLSVLAREGVARVVADQFLPEAWSDWCARERVEVIRPVLDPRACLRLTALRSGGDPSLVLPMYPREPEAVTKWRERKKGSGRAGPG